MTSATVAGRHLGGEIRVQDDRPGLGFGEQARIAPIVEKAHILRPGGLQRRDAGDQPVGLGSSRRAQQRGDAAAGNAARCARKKRASPGFVATSTAYWPASWPSPGLTLIPGCGIAMPGVRKLGGTFTEGSSLLSWPTTSSVMSNA